MYKACHAKIREDPSFTKEDKSKVTNTRKGNKIVTSEGVTYTRNVKMSLQQRKDRVKQKMASALSRAMGAAEDDEE